MLPQLLHYDFFCWQERLLPITAFAGRGIYSSQSSQRVWAWRLSFQWKNFQKWNIYWANSSHPVWKWQLVRFPYNGFLVRKNIPYAAIASPVFCLWMLHQRCGTSMNPSIYHRLKVSQTRTPVKSMKHCNWPQLGLEPGWLKQYKLPCMSLPA